MSHWPQWCYLAIVFWGFSLAIRDHGKPRKPENAWISAVAIAITMTLLALGGFFSGMFAP